MEISRNQIDELVTNPFEGLNVEIKRWIDPSLPEGQAKIIKGCLALRNRNGGFFIIGFDDKTLLPDAGNAPAKPREVFHVDKIQALISKYAQDIFEISVAFSSRDGVDYPVIVIPAGIQSPVAVKQSLTGADNKALISVRDVYFRTLNSNGIPSSSVAHPKDWREIFEICFENREADIGRFFRRHLNASDRQALAETLMQIGFVAGLPSSPQISLRERSEALLGAGFTSYQAALTQRKLTVGEQAIANGLSWEIALTVEPELPVRTLDNDFLREVLASNPRYTGWPIWLDSQGFSKLENRPYRVQNAWETLVVDEGGFAKRLDFWHFEPNRFYLRRALQDDLSPKVTPGSVLDPILVIIRVAEAIVVGISIVRSILGGDVSPERRLGFAFRWTKLSNRRLQTWANPMVGMIGSPVSHIDEATTFVEVPSDTPIKAVSPFVDEATRELFALFEGERIPANSIELWTQRLLDRQL